MTHPLRRLAPFALAALALAAPALAASWQVDEPHTAVNFSVKHFFTPVSGTFRDFDVDLAFDPDHPEKSHVRAVIRVASVDTGNEMRDNHLRSADWFAAEQYPTMVFESTSVQARGDQLVAKGRLTIKDQTHDFVLPIEALGVREIPEPMREMLGGSQKVASFSSTTTLDRADFGVGVGSWAATAVVGGEVEIEILLEAHLR